MKRSWTNNDLVTPRETLRLIYRLSRATNLVLSEPHPIVWLDPCSNSASFVQARHKYDLCQGTDGLRSPWFFPDPDYDANFKHKLVFVNPPYGAGLLEPWTQKALEESQNMGMDENIVMLLPADKVEQRHMQDLLLAASSVCFLRGRIQFHVPALGHANGSGRFPSMLVWLGRGRTFFSDMMYPNGAILERP